MSQQNYSSRNNNDRSNNNYRGGRQYNSSSTDNNNSRYHDSNRQQYDNNNRQQGGGGAYYSRNNNNSGGDYRSSSNNYKNNRNDNYHDGNYRNYDHNKTVSMKQSHHNNSSSSDSFKYKENYNRRDERVNNSKRINSEQDHKRKTVDSNIVNNNEHVKKVKINEPSSTTASLTNPIIPLDKKDEISEERLKQLLTSETLLLQNNDEEQVAARREERRQRFKQMEELILSEVVESNHEDNNNTENSADSDSDEEAVEPLKDYNTHDERALFIHQIEKHREKEMDSDDKSDTHITETKVTSLYDEDKSNSESPVIDMFADSPDTLVKLLNTNTNLDNNTSTELYDDAEGYYRYTIGEVMNQRYKVEQFLGQGVFSGVVKATDLNSTKSTAQTPTLVAIKIIRNIESMKKAGLKELDLLSKINEKDTQEYNIIKMVESFTYRNHLCIVFELLEMNLRDVLKNYGKAQGHQHSVGISIQACKIYTKQLVNALKYIQDCNIIHADIKPDNILLDHSHQFVKLSDFGSACHISENTITPYLVSRFYRAPEIILGMKYSYPIDMWSIACTIYELYTGKILFTSQNNNDHLRLVMELKGKFPNKVLKKCAFRENHFESDGAFLFREFDKLTKKIKVSKIYFQRNTRDLKAMLLNSMLQNHKQDENDQVALVEEKKQVMFLHDFLEKALSLDPSKRLSASDALLHPFITN